LGDKPVQVSVVQVLVFALRGLKRGLEGVEVEIELGLVRAAQLVHRPSDPHRRADLLTLEISEATVSFRKCHPCLLRPTALSRRLARCALAAVPWEPGGSSSVRGQVRLAPTSAHSLRHRPLSSKKPNEFRRCSIRAGTPGTPV